MHADDATPATPDEEAARLIQQGLDPVVLPTGPREALLRRILERIGGEPPLAPAPPRQGGGQTSGAPGGPASR